MTAGADLIPFWQPYCGAVSLTFDDGTENQLKNVVPVLNALQIKGTFYIHPTGDDWSQRLAPWQQVAASGHEIGNHTLSHFCPNNILGRNGGLEDLTLFDLENDILAAQQRLNWLAPEQKHWTFAYPCYGTHVGRGAMRQSYVPIIARHFLAGRAGGEYGFGNNPHVIDLACVWGLATERMSGFEMIGLVEELTACGQWVILVFHEVDGQRLSVSSSDFHMLLRYLDRKRSSIWTDTVARVAEKF